MLHVASTSAYVQGVGEKFSLTDDEIVNHFLKLILLGNYHEINKIPILNIYDYDPWDLPQLSWVNSNDQERYYFSPLSAKNPGSNNGRFNRSTKRGSWQGTGKDKIITDELTEEKIAIMKIFVHSHKEHGIKWVMHEYRATLNLENEEILVLCKIMKKPDNTGKRTDMKVRRPYKKTKMPSHDKGEASCNMDFEFADQNAYEKTGLSTYNEDQTTSDNSDEGEKHCLTISASENYVADVTNQEEAYSQPLQYHGSFLRHDQQDYSYFVPDSPMLTGHGLYYNVPDTFDTTISASENYVAGVTNQEEVYSQPLQYHGSFLCHNQQDYGYFVPDSPMLTGHGLYYNVPNTFETTFEDQFNASPLLK